MARKCLNDFECVLKALVKTNIYRHGTTIFKKKQAGTKIGTCGIADGIPIFNIYTISHSLAKYMLVMGFCYNIILGHI